MLDALPASASIMARMRSLAARGESPALHRGRRCARLARRDEREYREYLNEEQRSQPGCSAGRMQLEFHHGLLAVLAVAAWSVAAGAPDGSSRAPLVVERRVPDGGIQPQAAVDDHGTVHLIYFRGDPSHGDVFYVRSTDGGTTFSPAIQVNHQPGSAIATGSVRGAQIAVGRN